MTIVKVVYGDEIKQLAAAQDTLLGDAIVATGLPLEQPCAGRGTCGKCKVLVEGSLSPPDEIELEQLSSAEIRAGYRLACRTRLKGDANVTLAPIVVYSNKIFRASDDYKRGDSPLGLAIDLGSTTVAAFLTRLNDGMVCAGAAALNQQTVFGADVISRLAAAGRDEDNAQRLSALAQASIVQAIDALKLSRRVQRRIRKVTVVGNCAMHHLLLRYPVDSLAVIPFQPHELNSVRGELFPGVVPAGAEVALPPLIGGFVGAGAPALLGFFYFDLSPWPLGAPPLWGNAEGRGSHGERILGAPHSVRPGP